MIVFKKEESAAEVLRYAKLLRDASNEKVSTSVFINADLTPTEAKMAFEMREKRRARNLQRSSSSQHPSNQTTTHSQSQVNPASYHVEVTMEDSHSSTATLAKTLVATSEGNSD